MVNAKAADGCGYVGELHRRAGALGASLLVPAGKSILEVLEANQLNISFSCREGLCATCETPVLAGKPDHRDSVLTAAEKAANNTHDDLRLSRAV